MAYVSIDLDEIRTWELIDELENRYLEKHEKEQLASIVQTPACDKISFFLKVMDRYSMMELSELFKESYSTPPVPKEQLQLFS